MRAEERRDIACIVVGAIASFFLASVMLSDWPAGLKPNLAHPYIYAGDGLFQLWLAQRLIEGWIFQNPRSGFPFGSEAFDFPGSDAGNLLVTKALGWLSGTYYGAFNLYILLGFAVTFAVTFWVLRRIDVRRGVACVAALLFAFVPYHFYRLLMGHTFYTWYFVVPVYFYCGWRVYRGALTPRSLLACCAAVAAAACFGVYFALFGVLTVVLCGLAASAREGTLWPLLLSIALGVSISIGVLVNVAPNISHTLTHGKNPEVARRAPPETELYSLKLSHLLMPAPDHRVKPLREFAREYATTFPLSNTVSSVGVVGLFGLLVLAAAFVRSMGGRAVDQRLRLLVLLTAASLLVATVGGLNVLFATLISPMIRGWDRFSIFIAFYALAGAAVWASMRWLRAGAAPWVALAVVAVLGLAEQTAGPTLFTSVSKRDHFERDRDLVQKIEAELPRGAAIYQLPFVQFPESANTHNLGTYDPLTGFMNSKELRWSSGGMMGRKAAVFYRALAQKPMAEQLATIKAMGFSGIYVHRAGYADNGAAVVQEITRLTGNAPAMNRADGGVSFFKLGDDQRNGNLPNGRL